MCTHLYFASTFMTFMTSWPHDLKTTDEHPLFLQTITQANHLITNHLHLTLTSCRCRFCKQIPPISLDLRPKCCIFALWKGYHSHDWINETHNLQLQPENHQPQPLTIKIFTHYGNQVKATERNVSFEKNKEKWAYVMMPETYSTLVAIGTALGVSCIAGHWPAPPRSEANLPKPLSKDAVLLPVPRHSRHGAAGDFQWVRKSANHWWNQLFVVLMTTTLPTKEILLPIAVHCRALPTKKVFIVSNYHE